MYSIDEIIVIIAQLVKNKLKQIDDSSIEYDDILSEYGLDSVAMIELIVEIEEQFEIEFEPVSLDYRILKSIQSIANQVNRLQELR